MTPAQHQALREISSATPAVRHWPAGDEACAMCRCMIDHAREALGVEPWPAAAHTPIVPVVRDGDA